MLKLQRIILGLVVSVLPLQVFALDNDTLKESYNSSPQMMLRKGQPRSMSESIPHEPVRRPSSRAATIPTATSACDCPPWLFFMPNSTINFGGPINFEQYLKMLPDAKLQETSEPLSKPINKPADPNSPKTMTYKKTKEAVLSRDPGEISKALKHGKYGLNDREYNKLLNQTNSPAIQQIINNAMNDSKFDPIHFTN